MVAAGGRDAVFSEQGLPGGSDLLLLAANGIVEQQANSQRPSRISGERLQQRRQGGIASPAVRGAGRAIHDHQQSVQGPLAFAAQDSGGSGDALQLAVVGVICARVAPGLQGREQKLGVAAQTAGGDQLGGALVEVGQVLEGEQLGCTAGALGAAGGLGEGEREPLKQEMGAGATAEFDHEFGGLAQQELKHVQGEIGTHRPAVQQTRHRADQAVQLNERLQLARDRERGIALGLFNRLQAKFDGRELLPKGIGIRGCSHRSSDQQRNRTL